MYWHDCSNEPPKYDGVYQVLILDDDRQHWRNVYGLYNVKYNSWELHIDGLGWSGDSGREPAYWYKIPTFPPVPYEGPKCKYFKDNYCIGQKNAPRCWCQGDENKCEK